MKNMRDHPIVGKLVDDPYSLFDSDFAPPAPKVGDRIEPPIGTVHANPNQPRRRFPSDEILDEKAARIRARVDRGLPPFVQLPTVIPHPTLPGEWQIQTGGIRHETGRRAELVTFPCQVVDPALDDPGAPMLENIDRTAMDSMDIAEGLRDLIRDKGMSKGEAGMSVGLKASQVSEYLALLELPDCLMAMYEAGRCRSVRVLYDLAQAHARYPAQVERWSGTAESVTKAGVRRLCEAWSKGQSGSGEAASTEEDRGDVGVGEVVAATGEVVESGSVSSVATGDGVGAASGRADEAGAESDRSGASARGPKQDDAQQNDAQRDAREGTTGRERREERGERADGESTGHGEGAGVETVGAGTGGVASRVPGPEIVLRGQVQARGADGSVTHVDLGGVVDVRGTVEVTDAEGVVHEVDVSGLVLVSRAGG